MSTLVPGTITSNTLNTPYDSIWASIYDTDMQVPQIWGELMKYYGDGVGLLEWLYAAGSIVPIAGPHKTLFEEGALVKTVEIVGAIAAVGEGADAHLHLALAEFTDVNGNVLTDACYLSANDIVVIPAEYLEISGVQATKPENYQVTTVTAADGVLKQFTIRPLNVHSEIAVPVPTGTKLMVTGGNYPNGVQSGTPKSSGWYHRHFDTSTKKADWGMTGSIQSNERYYEKLRGGGTGIFTKATIEADFFLSKAINDEIILGGGISNTLTMPDRQGNNVQATGTVGLLQHMVDAAMKQYYTLSYSAPDFDDIKDLLNSQGVTGRNVAFLTGSLLQKQIENAGLEFLKEFAGGTVLSTLNSWGVDFRQIHKNGVTYTLKELPSFSDPTSFGAAAFEDYFSGLGFIIPDVDVTVRGTLDDPASFKLKNLVLGYKNYNGENRTRVNKILQGAASVGGAGSHLYARDTYDDVYGTMLSEFMVIVLRRNQMIMVANDVII